MVNRVLLAAVAAASLSTGCRGKKASTSTCRVVERSLRQVDGSLEVAVAVRWTVAGKNYRHNKPVVIGRFDGRENTAAALEKRFAPGAEIECSIDPARPTRVDLPDVR